MEIGRLVNQIRSFMGEAAVIEIPAWPYHISEPWMHPDFFLRCGGSFEGEIFSIQNVIKNSELEATPSVIVPYLIWMKKSFSNKWMEEAINFSSLFFRNIDEPEPSIELFGTIQKGGILSEKGASWKIYRLGVQFGEIKIVSGCFDENFKQPSVFFMVDLEKIAWIQEKDSDFIYWDRGIPMMELAAFNSFGMRLPSVKNGVCDILKRWDQVIEVLEESIEAKKPFESYAAILDSLTFLHSLKAKMFISNEFFRQKIGIIKNYSEKILKLISKFQVTKDSGKGAWR
ncbi:MAG: hypothetical protein HQM08_02320 [Candidatus Riflebacteria bacterium]|nr:hypothetical protein [Candidatus Riflebacteria bacterium]